MMELEFDKEIDAILRKARAPVGAAGSAVTSGHLDADTVAAFAENALPIKALQLYTEHFADCDRCRKLLLQAILTNTEAVATTASAVSAPAVEAVMPWYGKLFRTPNLALAIGALVLAFSCVLGYLALQNRNSSKNADVALVTEPAQSKGGPYYSGESSANASNSNAAGATNSMANAANIPTTNAPAIPSAMSNPASNTTANAMGRADSTTGAGQPEKERGFALDGVTAEAPKPATAAPPKPVDQPLADRDERKAGDDKTKDNKMKEEINDLALSKQSTESRMAREAVPPSAKKTGPNRASGPRQNQNTQNEMSNQIAAGMLSAGKTVGGKTFENRNGAWYDRAYHGQATTDVRRATDAYKKLDRGLRVIAEAVGGTVVVVWKNKAYRIQ